MSSIESRILTLFSRTPVHVGAGNSVGAVDSPVMRERHTRIPIIPGSSLKGVLADLWTDADNCEYDTEGIPRRKAGSEASWLFGSDDNKEASAGALLIGEARVLVFPVRSARGSFAWITCPLVLARYKRDARTSFDVPAEMGGEECYASEAVALDGKVVLEEYCLKSKGETGVSNELQHVVGDEIWKQIHKRLVIVSDEMFSYFVEQACEVVTRIRIDDRTGVVARGALFNQENIPSETLFYTMVSAQPQRGKLDGGRHTASEALETLSKKVKEIGVIQLGGDETIGLGFCSVDITTIPFSN